MKTEGMGRDGGGFVIRTEARGEGRRDGEMQGRGDEGKGKMKIRQKKGEERWG